MFFAVREVPSTPWLPILGRVGEIDPALRMAAVCLASQARKTVSRIRFQIPQPVGADVRPSLIPFFAAIQSRAGIAIYREQNP
jgi:hypothetical protein